MSLAFDPRAKITSFRCVTLRPSTAPMSNTPRFTAPTGPDEGDFTHRSEYGEFDLGIGRQVGAQGGLSVETTPEATPVLP